ncbi:RMtype1_S_Csp16704I_TRD2-CR2_like domain containing protein [Candidatus Pelagibacterales bacterium]
MIQYRKLKDLILENKKSNLQVRSSSVLGSYIFFTSGEKTRRSDKKLVDGENIYLATGGKAYVQYYKGDSSYSTDCYSIKAVKTLAECKYLYYFLISIIDKINKEMFEGAALKHLQKKKLLNCDLLLPQLPIQQTIVAKLDKIFAEIDKSIAAVEANLINAEILFKSYLKKIFLLYGKNFKEYSIGDVCKIIGGGTPSKSNNQFYQGNIPWATVRDMNQEIIEKTQFKITNEAVTKSSTNVILKNNVIIATRVGLGKICIIKSDTAINQDLKAVIPLDSKVLEIYYLFYWFKSIANLIIEAGRGSTVNGVKLDFIKSLKIKIPNIDIQKNIINSINNIKYNINYIILTNNKKIIQLKLLKQSILQQAFSGKLVKAA